MKDTAERLLYQLKSRGAQSAARLAEGLGLSGMGVHKQLQALAEAGLVEAGAAPQAGPGRPRRLWRLTAAGHGRFPDRHGELTVQLIRHAQALGGPPLLDALIAAREQEAEARYAERLRGARALGERVRRLAALREEEGYLARAEAEPGGRAWLLVEDHCPICAAASHCQGFCRSELALFQRVLGPGCVVLRSEHLLAGARRCVYRITAASSSRPGPAA